MRETRFGEAILLEDTKNTIRERIDPNGEALTAFDLLMRSFRYFLNEENDSGPDYENREFAKGIYSILGWETCDCYDVINSFYNLFKCALVFSDVLNSSAPTEYRFGDNNILEYRNQYGFSKIGKQKHIEKILTEGNTCCIAVNRFITDDCNHKEIACFSSLCHCVANFMPCPEQLYNTLKGCLLDVRDFFPLMIDKIQQCTDEGASIECHIKNSRYYADHEKLIKWHEWFINNREKYFLTGYYDVIGERLVGKPFFHGQSLQRPFPETAKEVGECASEILKRIKDRASQMIHSC